MSLSVHIQTNSRIKKRRIPSQYADFRGCSPSWHIHRCPDIPDKPIPFCPRPAQTLDSRTGANSRSCNKNDFLPVDEENHAISEKTVRLAVMNSLRTIR